MILQITNKARGAEGYNYLISNKRDRSNCLIKTPTKYRKLKQNNNLILKVSKNSTYAYHICNSWYNASYTNKNS